MTTADRLVWVCRENHITIEVFEYFGPYEILHGRDIVAKDHQAGREVRDFISNEKLKDMDYDDVNALIADQILRLRPGLKPDIERIFA